MDSPAKLRRQKQPDALAAAAESVRKAHNQLSPSEVDDLLRLVGLSEYTSGFMLSRPGERITLLQWLKDLVRRS